MILEMAVIRADFQKSLSQRGGVDRPESLIINTVPLIESWEAYWTAFYSELALQGYGIESQIGTDSLRTIFW